MNAVINTSAISLLGKFFWRFVLLFLLIYIIPYDLAFGFTEKFEEWRWWHKPIFGIGEYFFGWEFDYSDPSVGWDSKFEVCRYIFIGLLGSVLAFLWLVIDTVYVKIDYEEKVITLTQTFLRYRIAIVMLHYGIAKVFMFQFGTMDIDTLESTIGDYSPMGLMWKYLSFSEEIQLFSGWVETIGAILLFFRKTTFLGGFLLIIALVNVVLWDIAYSVSVTLYAIQLLLLTLILVSNQFKSFYDFLVVGKTTVASKYKSFVKAKYAKTLRIVKTVLLVLLSVFYSKRFIAIQKDYFSSNYKWFTGLHNIDVFIKNGDTIITSGTERRWTKIIFNDAQYFNDSFKIEFEEAKDERFKFTIDSVAKTIQYRDHADEKAPWHEIRYQQIDKDKFQFKGVFKNDTIIAKTTIKRLEDYRLMSKKGSWLVDLD